MRSRSDRSMTSSEPGCTSGGGDADAAVAGLGVEPGREVIGGSEAFEQAREEVEVHAADECAVLLGEAVEGAVCEGDLLAAPELGLVAVAGEDVEDGGSSVVS